MASAPTKSKSSPSANGKPRPLTLVDFAAHKRLPVAFLEERGVVESPLGGILFRYADVLAPNHQLVGIAHVRLGHTLVLERRFADAEKELTTGYGILKSQTSPPATWLGMAQTDLVAVYDSLKQPEKAVPFRAELAQAKKTADSPPRR